MTSSDFECRNRLNQTTYLERVYTRKQVPTNFFMNIVELYKRLKTIVREQLSSTSRILPKLKFHLDMIKNITTNNFQLVFQLLASYLITRGRFSKMATKNHENIVETLFFAKISGHWVVFQ